MSRTGSLFEGLTKETVLDITEVEVPFGVVVSIGGQTPNNLAMALHEQGVRIVSTSGGDRRF